MKLSKIKTGVRVFIDANIFIYHFTGVSEDCSELLFRCEQHDLIGFTSVNVLLEVLHRLMLVEVVKKKLLKPPNLVKKLQKQPGLVKKLNAYKINTIKIYQMGIEILGTDYNVILKSQDYREKYGLMVNDSVIVASMQEKELNVLATNDNGFSAVDEIMIYKPGDIR